MLYARTVQTCPDNAGYAAHNTAVHPTLGHFQVLAKALESMLGELCSRVVPT